MNEFDTEEETPPEDSQEELTPVSLNTGPQEDESAPLDTGVPTPEPQEAPKTYGGIPEHVMGALTWQESRDNPNARSKAGAMGVAQVMPSMWKAYGGGDPYDPEQNKEVAGKILNDEMARFSGNQELAFAAYNAGSPRVISALKQAGYSLRDAAEVPFDAIKDYLPPETQSYVPSIMNRIVQNTLREPNAYASSGTENSVPNSDDPNNVGNADYLKKKVQDMLSTPGFEDSTATEKIAALTGIWRTKPYWDEESKPMFKKLATVAWDGATSAEQIDFGELAGPVPLIKGKNEKEQNEELQTWKNEKDDELVKMGINPLFLGEQWDNHFKEAGKSEKQAKAYRDRGIVAHVAGYPVAAGEAVLQGFGSGLATTLSAVPRLAGYEETAQAIESVPEKILPTPRRDFNYQVDELGRLVTDEYGNPLTRMQGTIAGATGAIGSYFLPTTALKLAGAPKLALQALNISTMALQGANTAYQDTISNGGNRNQALLSAALAVPINTADSFVNLKIISGGPAWLKGLGPLNRARAMGYEFIKEGAIGGSANALTQYLQDLGVSAVIDKDITSGKRVFDQFVGGFVVGGAVGASQKTYALKPDSDLRNMTPEEQAKAKATEPPSAPPTELPKETEHERLTKVFEEFQNSPNMEMITNLRSQADLSPEHLAVFGYKAEPMPGGKVKIIKETTFQAPDISTLEGAPLHHEIAKLSESLAATPHFKQFPDVQKRYGELTTTVKEWGPDTYERAKQAKEYLAEQDAALARLQELKIKPEGETRQLYEIRKKAIDDTRKRLEELKDFTDKDAPGIKEAETLRELEQANQHLKDMQDSRYANNLMARDNHLKQLVLRRQKLDAERAIGGAAKEAGGETKEIDVPLGIQVGTRQGLHHIVPHENHWHLFNKEKEVVAGNFPTYGEALKYAKELTKPGRIGVEARMEGAEKPTPEALMHSARLGEHQNKFAEIEKAQAEWSQKEKTQAREALADMDEADRIQDRINRLTEREKKASSPEAKEALRRNIEEHQKNLDEVNANLKEGTPGVKEARMLREKKLVADEIKRLTGKGPGKGGELTRAKTKEEMPGTLWAEGEPTEVGAAKTAEADTTKDLGQYTSPAQTRQPNKPPNVPLDNTFEPGKVFAATEATKVNPRDIVALGRKVLKTLSNLRRQATSAGYSVFGGAARRLRTPEEAARLQREHPLDAREGGRGLGKHVLGFIDYLQRFIRADNYNDLTTLVHEITHAINTELFPEWHTFPQKVQEGLVKMGRAFYGDPEFDKYPLQKKLNEGWATWMEHYTSGQTIQKDVLDFYNGWFKDNYPTLHTDIETIKAQMENYYKMDPYTYAEVFMGAMPLKKPLLISSTQFWDDWIDRGAPIKEMQKLMGGKANLGDLYEANLGRAQEKASDITYGKGFRDWENNQFIDGMSAKEAIAPAKGHLPELSGYMLSKYTLARAGVKIDKQGNIVPLTGVKPDVKRTGFALKDAAKIVYDIEVANKNIYGDAVIKAHENLMNWYVNVMKLAASRSPYLADTVGKILLHNIETTGTDHGYYMPMVREVGDAVRDYSGAEGTKSSNPFMRFKGSDRRIQNPLLTLGEHATKLLNAAQNRYMYDTMINASRTGPLGAYITEVPRHMIPALEVSLKDNLKAINDKLRDKYGESVDISGISEDMLNDTIMFFKPEVKPPRAADGYQTIAYRQPGGRVEFYEVNPRVIKALDPSMPDVTKSAWFQWAFTKPGRIMRIGATTARMAYQLRNLVFRDFFTAWRRGDEVIPLGLLKEVFSSFTSHALHSLTNGKYTSPVLEFEKSLGIFNATRAGAAREIEREIERSTGKQVIGVVEKSFSWLENLLSSGEQATRTASMKLKAKQLGITDFTKPVTPEQAIELILAKKRSTTNFQVQGSSARTINLMVPFFTARIAELSQLKTDWKTKPVKQVGFASAYLALGIATALANKDEDWWQNLEPEEKATNWMTTMKDSQGNSRIIRVPLETLSGAFHGLGNLIGEQLIRQDVLKPSMTEASWGLLKQFIPITQAIDLAGVPGKEILSQEMNYDFFFKKSIVPKGLEEAPAHMQYTAATTELSKGIAARLHQIGLADWSPARIDHAFRALFPAGLDMIRSVENYSGVKPINDQATAGQDIMLNLVARGGYKESTMDRSTNKFYELDQKFRANKDIESPDEEKARKKLDKIRTAVSDINVILSAETDADARKELYDAKRQLLEQGIAIGEGDTTVSVGFSPYKYKAKSLRQQRKFERAKVQASSKQEKSIFSD